MDAAVVLGELVMDASVAPSEAAQPHRHWPRLLACRVLRGEKTPFRMGEDNSK